MTDEINDDHPAYEAEAIDVVEVPCSITLTSGKRFIVTGIGAWGWTAHGVFATGSFEGYENHESDLIIPESSIHYIALDYEAHRAWEAGRG